MPHSSSKRSTSIVLALLPEPTVQLVLVSIGVCSTTFIAVQRGMTPTRPVMSLEPIGTSRQSQIMTRITIHGMMSKILIEIWHSLSCIYSCLISYCSNQRSLASSVFDLQTHLVRSTSFLSGSVLLIISAPSLWSMSFLSLLQNMGSSFPLAHSMRLVTAYPVDDATLECSKH